MKWLWLHKRFLIYFLLAFFSYLLIRITLPYSSFNDKQGFLAIKQFVIHNQVWKTAFYTHVFTSCFLLVAGFTQFSDKFLLKFRKVHRLTGKSYVLILLFLSGPAGLVMALYANGGTYSRIGFVLLSVLWLVSTALAWLYAVRKDFQLHREWMIRSFALTVSALTLRLWKYLIVLFFTPNPMDVYRIVAWLGWIPNLLIAEWIIRRSKQSKTGE